MIFLFEEFCYKFDFLEDVIGCKENDFRSKSGFNTKSVEGGKNKVNGVGYCFYNGQPVFVLPKVFLDNDGKTAFGKTITDNGVDIFGNADQSENNNLNSIQRKFLSSISKWLYTAIDCYDKKNEDREKSGIRTSKRQEARHFEKNDRYATLIDITKSMEDFYKKNQNLFVFVAKNKHSGNSKINWQRTINKKIPFIQDGTPIYMDLAKKAKVFDLDDRLLVLYFSAMRYIQTEYSWPMPQSEFYQPLKKNEMDRLMENERGLRELKKIKHKYFDDRLLKLYNIMESFFRWGAKYKRKDTDMDEYLIANSFNNVFEDMIDELISDPKFEKEKKNKDGKIIDHLYKDESLIFASSEEKQKNDLIWYIGDSKYYSDHNKIGEQSIAKQFTYAKNVMQDFFSPEFFDNNEEHRKDDVHYGVRYRDKVTEGYSVTPNFFIRGEIPEYKGPKQFDEPFFREKPAADNSDLITKHDSEDLWDCRNRHFVNRLFDRDTLLLQTYNVNFLYVLKAYMPNQSALRRDFKDRARKMFRENFLELLDEKYNFYKIIPQNLSLDVFVEHRFKKWIGKMYCPETGENKTFLIYAEEKDSDTLLNATTSNQRIRVIDGDEFICLPLSVQDVLNAASDRDANPKVFVARATTELYKEIEENGVVTLPIPNGDLDAEMSCPKYLIALGNDQIRLFIVFGIADYNDSSTRLQVIEQKLYAEKVFDCNAILARADELAGHLIKWNDLNFL